MKLFNKNFILILQGQMVSTLGDSVYSVALAFFVLQLTGSSTYMGMVLGITTIPRIIFGPLAGAVVDRYNKKALIVLADIIRGVTILLVAFLAFTNALQIWMLFLVAVIDGLCMTFFNPAMETLTSEIVEEKHLLKANSTINMSVSIMDIIGQTVGGALYKVFGAPLLFLMNGISFLFSSATETFIKFKPKKPSSAGHSLWKDTREGLLYIYKENGLFQIILLSVFFNFLFGVVRVLIIPWFYNTEGFGEARYGLFNGFCSVGMLAGMFLLSVFDIKEKLRYHVYRLGVLSFVVFIVIAAFVNRFWVVLLCFTIAFAFQIAFNTIFQAVMMIKTDEHMRGKITSTKTTLVMAAAPVGNILGGMLGDLLQPRYAIIVSGGFALIISLFFLNQKKVREYFM